MVPQVNVNSTFLGTPQDQDLIGDGNEAIQDTRVAFQERLAVEHDADLAVQTRHGLHKTGSALLNRYTGSTGTFPSTRTTGDALGANDVGYIIYHVADKTIFVYNGGTPATDAASWYDLRKMATIFVDTISELTAAAGITVDGVLLKDSSIKASGGITTDGTTPVADTIKCGTLTATIVNGAVWQP